MSVPFQPAACRVLCLPSPPGPDTSLTARSLTPAYPAHRTRDVILAQGTDRLALWLQREDPCLSLAPTAPTAPCFPPARLSHGGPSLLLPLRPGTPRLQARCPSAQRLSPKKLARLQPHPLGFPRFLRARGVSLPLGCHKQPSQPHGHGGHSVGELTVGLSLFTVPSPRRESLGPERPGFPVRGAHGLGVPAAQCRQVRRPCPGTIRGCWGARGRDPPREGPPGEGPTQLCQSGRSGEVPRSHAHTLTRAHAHTLTRSHARRKGRSVHRTGSAAGPARWRSCHASEGWTSPPCAQTTWRNWR